MNKDSNASRDILIGMTDGLTITFVVAATLSALEFFTKFVLLGGLIQIFIGALAMGAGAFFAVKNELAENRAGKSGLLIGISYVLGGLIPLAPYFITDAATAFKISAVITTLLLLFLGYHKSKLVGERPIGGAIRTTLIGLFAAACSYGIAKLIMSL